MGIASRISETAAITLSLTGKPGHLCLLPGPGAACEPPKRSGGAAAHLPWELRPEEGEGLQLVRAGGHLLRGGHEEN